MNSQLRNRVVGDYGLSIATNLAIEGLYNKIADKPRERVLPATLGNAVYFNVRTLFRNLYGSMTSNEASFVPIKAYADVLEQEILVIQAVLLEEKPPLEAYFYAPSYDSLGKHYPNGELKDVSAAKMTEKVKKENDVLALLYQDKLKGADVPIEFNDLEIKTKVPYKAFIVTHYPVDLLHTSGFNKTMLLESHTGKVKQEDMWYTKLNGKNIDGIDRIPFNKATLQFFGDTGGMFKAQPMPARKRLVEIAEKYSWNQQTPRNRMLDTVKLAFEGAIENTLKKMWQ